MGTISFDIQRFLDKCNYGVINSYNSAKCYELFLLMLFYIFRQDSIVLRHLTADDIMTFIIGANG